MRFLFFALLVSHLAVAQFAPPQGQVGSTAMYKDSSVFVSWAASCKITRGPQDISNPGGGYATVGDSTSAVNISDGTVVSLGDGGSATCTFLHALYNGPGYDFAVFENSFDGNYLELAFVEVSSDGINFFRFPTTSNTQDSTQTGGFGNTDATKINNLAGKYKAQYGTPFDLSELQGITGLDINQVTHVKIIDVVGSINEAYATHDKNNHKVNDPWPTPYASSGFDLDAIGVINQQSSNSILEINADLDIAVYPNPAATYITVHLDKNATDDAGISIMDVNGKTVLQKRISPAENITGIDISELDNGFYFLQVKNTFGCITKKISITK